MKLFTETYESFDTVRNTLVNTMYINVDRIITRYVTDKNTGQTHQSMIIYTSDEYSSILFDIQHNKIFNGIKFYEHTRNMVPALYIPSIHFSVDISELFIELFGHDYLHRFIRLEKEMDEDGNTPLFVFFHQTLPRTDSLKEFYLELYRNGYRIEKRDIIHFQLYHLAPKKHKDMARTLE